MNERIVGFLIKSQQFYLKELGFYSGAIDGRWNDECREAMSKFKKEEIFKPANSRRKNEPFLPFERLPNGFKWGIFDGQRGIIKEDSEVPYIMNVQNLVDGILNIDDVYDEKRRNAYDVIGIKNPSQEETSERSESISDFI